MLAFNCCNNIKRQDLFVAIRPAGCCLCEWIDAVVTKQEFMMSTPHTFLSCPMGCRREMTKALPRSCPSFVDFPTYRTVGHCNAVCYKFPVTLGDSSQEIDKSANLFISAKQNQVSFSAGCSGTLYWVISILWEAEARVSLGKSAAFSKRQREREVGTYVGSSLNQLFLVVLSIMS